MHKLAWLCPLIFFWAFFVHNSDAHKLMDMVGALTSLAVPLLSYLICDLSRENDHYKKLNQELYRKLYLEVHGHDYDDPSGTTRWQHLRLAALKRLVGLTAVFPIKGDK
ncbi:MAG TPA: hypothetical protein VGJ20_46465 [Xanthobacteraceae bacterium]|jgi:hypothetical protein